jgi:hypothetical protein
LAGRRRPEPINTPVGRHHVRGGRCPAGFSILGAFSVGLFFAPICLLFAISGALAAWRTKLSFLTALACFAAAGIGQAALMLNLLRLQPSVLILAAAPAIR